MSKKLLYQNHCQISSFHTPQNRFSFLNQAYWRMEKINEKQIKAT
jgi:hypothetical protein